MRAEAGDVDRVVEIRKRGEGVKAAEVVPFIAVRAKSNHAAAEWAGAKGAAQVGRLVTEAVGAAVADVGGPAEITPSVQDLHIAIIAAILVSPDIAACEVGGPVWRNIVLDPDHSETAGLAVVGPTLAEHTVEPWRSRHTHAGHDCEARRAAACGVADAVQVQGRAHAFAAIIEREVPKRPVQACPVHGCLTAAHDAVKTCAPLTGSASDVDSTPKACPPK